MQSNSGPMTANQSGTARKLAIVASLGAMGFAGFAVALLATPGNIVHNKLAASPAPITNQPQAQSTANPGPVSWVAAAPGRVEPRSGQIRIGTACAAASTRWPSRHNDKVAEGEVLIRLDDKEARARLTAAEAEAAARKRERDAQPATAGRERCHARPRTPCSRPSAPSPTPASSSTMRSPPIARAPAARSPVAGAPAAGRRQGPAAPGAVGLRLRAGQEQRAGAQPARSRAASPARAEVTLAETMLDKTRIRAPIAGTVLQINAKLGELVAPSPEMPLVVMGDMSVHARARRGGRAGRRQDQGGPARVRAQQRLPGPGVRGQGRPSWRPRSPLPRMGSRGARRATDVEVMEVMIDLDGTVPLLPGMRADAFFRR